MKISVVVTTIKDRSITCTVDLPTLHTRLTITTTNHFSFFLSIHRVLLTLLLQEESF